MHSVCEIWRFFDGKAGHRNQVLGLSEALGRTVPTACHDVDVSSGLKGLRSLIPGRLRSLRDLPTPSVLIGAGHSTHIPMLAARRKFGGRVIVLMKPSLPLSFFDVCLIPRADDLRRTPANVILTEGALNRIRPALHPDPNRGLILIGGPSDHFGWSDQDVLQQVRRITEASQHISWTLTTSRRTPRDFCRAWSQAGIRAECVPVEQTAPDWLPARLQECGTVWVTNESVSMIYEALTSGAEVGILSLLERTPTRVTRGIQSLIQRQLVTSFAQWQSTGVLRHTPFRLDEASRCARLIASHWLCDAGSEVQRPRISRNRRAG